MPKERLHERLRGLIPESVQKRIPSRLKPPAWREPESAPEPSPWAEQLKDPQQPLPDAALGESGAPKFVPGTRVMVWSNRPGGGTTVYQDSKLRDLPVPIEIPYGTEGVIVRVNPDSVAVRFGENTPQANAPIYTIDKADVIHVKPETARDWRRRGWRLRGRILRVTARDLRRAA